MFFAAPARVRIPPREVLQVPIHFSCDVPRKVDGVLSLRTAHTRYQVPLFGEVEEGPLIICDKPVLNLGAIAEGDSQF